jgi:hypothetical protein
LSPFSPAGREQLVERDDVDEADLAEDRVQVLERDAELGGHLGLGRGAVQRGLERGVGLLDLAGLVAHRAGDPVDRAQLVDDRALDAADRVGLELDRALEVELLDRVDEPEDAVGDEVGLLDVGRQAHADAAGDVLHQRRVVQDQPLAQPLLAGGLVLAPQLGDGRLDLGPLLVADARRSGPRFGRRLRPGSRPLRPGRRRCVGLVGGGHGARTLRAPACPRSWLVLTGSTLRDPRPVARA